MPDKTGRFLGISVSAASWERIFGRKAKACEGCDDPCLPCTSVSVDDLTPEQLRELDKYVGGSE